MLAIVHCLILGTRLVKKSAHHLIRGIINVEVMFFDNTPTQDM